MLDVYGDNKLVNPKADDDLTGWTVGGDVTVEAGGEGSPANCFRIGSTGNMSQSITVNPQPEDVKIMAKFLPEYPPMSSAVKTYIVCEMHYADGTKDIYSIPCVGRREGI